MICSECGEKKATCYFGILPDPIRVYCTPCHDRVQSELYAAVMAARPRFDTFEESFAYMAAITDSASAPGRTQRGGG